MPATLDDIFTLEQMRQELRQPNIVDAEVDSLLPGYFGAAVSWIVERTRYPILDQNRTIYLNPRSNVAPIEIPFSHILSITSIKYWTQFGQRYDLPNGTVSPLGRLEKHETSALQWPDIDGWPPSLAGMNYEFILVRGVTELPTALRQSIILLASDLFNGAPEIKPRASVLILLSPFESYKNTG